MKLAPLWYEIVVPLRVLDYLKQKEEFLIVFTNSSAIITKKINFEK